MKLRLHVIVLTGLFFVMMSSCKKEYVDKINIIPGDTIQIAGYTNIESFHVNEFSKDTVLKASIKADTIMVYWPAYKSMPATIKPVITLPDSAKISPASGAEVAFKTGTTYTVTSGAGTSHVYVLKVVFQQPVPWFLAVLQYGEFENGYYMTLGQADGFIPDTALTKVYLVSAIDSTEYQAEVAMVNEAGPGFFVPWNAPEGLYDVKVVNGIHTIYNTSTASRNQLKIIYPASPKVFNVNIPMTIHRNDTFAIRGCLLETTNLARVLSSTGSIVILEVVRTSIDKVILKIPADFPLAKYTTIQLKREDGMAASTVINMTVEN